MIQSYNLQGSNINTFFHLSVGPQTSVQDHASLKYDDNRDDPNVHVGTPASGNENQVHKRTSDKFHISFSI